MTGGAKGIGRAIVLRLARDGADEAIADLGQEKANAVADDVRTMGRKSLVALTDVSDRAQVFAAVERTANELGGFDIMIISSGGNAGSQATTLVIRALALGEVRSADVWRVIRREFPVGLALGVLLAVIGAIRILLWQRLFGSYGEHSVFTAITVSSSLVGVELWGTLAGSALPFVLRFVKLDPASASAPLVATLVDVTGLIIYFTIAGVVLRGTLL